MKTHRRILHDVMPTRTVPVQSLAGALRAGPPSWTARGMLILALALGGLGAGTAVSSGHGSADHASSYQPEGNIHLVASASPTAIRPWIY